MVALQACPVKAGTVLDGQAGMFAQMLPWVPGAPIVQIVRMVTVLEATRGMSVQMAL